MYPTLDLDFAEIPAYTALAILGVIIGILTTWLDLRLSYRRAATIQNFLDGVFVVVITSGIGARLYHVATHWDYYSARSDEIAQIDLGGMAMRGALIAGIIAVLVYTQSRKISFARFADASVLGLAIGQAIGWAGALAHGANYGIESDSWLAMDLPDLYGLVAPRFPLQLAEITLFAALFVGLGLHALTKPRPGIITAIYFVISSAANLALGFQRGDETLWFGGLRIDQWFDASILAIALAFWFIVRYDRKVGINQ